MGLCINVFGVPILGDKDCADKYRNDRNDRHEVNKDAAVAKNQSNNDRKSSNTDSRNEQQALSSYFRNYGTGEGDVVGAFDASFGAIGEVGAAAAPIAGALATGGASSLLGGLGGIGGLLTGGAAPAPSSSLSSLTSNPLVLLALAGAVAAVVYSSESK